MYQHFYSRFLAANQGKQHYACHSHYYWPDVTREAMLQYWDDSAKHVDDKWQVFFSDVVPALQASISDILGTDDPAQIVFAPNTHELVYRILSCFDFGKPLTILSTDSEFHSFHRQANRLAEHEHVTLVSTSSMPFATFTERFIQQIRDTHPDVVFFSQVFFNSGFAVEDIQTIVDAIDNPNTIIVIDGYHSFMARPIDISKMQSRVFFLAGGYKYAQAGEGVCFAHVPPGCTLRPAHTGWYAEFGALDKPRDGQVQYSQDGMRFAGATMDFSALYRLRAVFKLLEDNNITVRDIHEHVSSLQRVFLEKLDECGHPQLNRDNLLVKDTHNRGHFLTFQLPDADTTAELAAWLRKQGIFTDYRGDRIRFGLGLYHTADSIDLTCLKQHAGV
ncbi:aminotransferase class V-fold PLP-dependent enzyme [Alteromonas halophila]|nr:aminotransferase class V-fold PLP-dependent enzyme [Alteromonas halophila]